MPTKRLPLVSVPQPCSVAWDAMTGTDRARRCAQCDRTIHNLSAMTATEAERLLAACGAERLCVTFSRGPNGEIVTADRPARFSWGRLAVASNAAAAAALTLTMATPAASPVAAAASQNSAQAAPAPAPRGGLRGTIRIWSTDESGYDAIVKAIDRKTGEEFATTAAKDGTYHLPLRKGRYDVTISLEGFETCHVDGVDMAGRLVTADVRLSVPTIGETVAIDKAYGCNNKKLNRLVHGK